MSVSTLLLFGNLQDANAHAAAVFPYLLCYEQIQVQHTHSAKRIPFTRPTTNVPDARQAWPSHHLPITTQNKARQGRHMVMTTTASHTLLLPLPHLDAQYDGRNHIQYCKTFLGLRYALASVF